MRAEADAALDDYLRVAREFPQPHYRWRPPFVLALHAMLDGDFDRADRLAGEGLALAEEASQVAGLISWALQRLSIALLRDDPSSLAADAERVLHVVSVLPAMAVWSKPFSALVLAATGRESEARQGLAGIVFEQCAFPEAIMLGHLVLLLRDRSLAEPVYRELVKGRRDNPFFWTGDRMAVFGPASRIAGDIAVMLGRVDEARTLLDEAVEDSDRIGSPPLVAQARARRDALDEPATRAHAAPASRLEIHLVREGDVWRIRSSAGGEAVLKDAKGLHYLAELLRHPGRDLHVTQLADMLEPAGDAGPVLDARAKDAYKSRLDDLRDQLEEARGFDDMGRGERVKAEIDALVEQLSGALGLGGRDRKMGSHVERARINVQRRLKDVLRRVEKQDTALGRYLSATVKTGAWCAFMPL